MTVAETAVRPGQLYDTLLDGRWAFYLDHHLLSTFSTCELKFKYAHLMNLRQKGLVPFSWAVGSWWSEVMSEFYELMAVREVAPHEMIILAAKHWIGEKMESYKTTSPKEYNKFGGTDTEFVLEGKAVALPAGAITMANDYHEQNYVLDKNNWKILATETAFGHLKEVMIGENDFVKVYWMGRPDLMVMDNYGRIMPVDHKTKDRITYDFDSLWKPHPQTAGYIVAAQQLLQQLGYTDKVIDRCVISGAARDKPTENRRDGKDPAPRFKRAFPCYSAEELEEWRSRTVRKVTRLRSCIEHDDWVDKDSSCHFFGGCTYRPIDAVTPSSRPTVIKALYTEAEPWSPNHD